MIEILKDKTAIVGVAKTAFAGAGHAVPLKRGRSEKPLFITAAGLPAAEAAQSIGRMAGTGRIPALLRRVDHLSRGLA